MDDFWDENNCDCLLYFIDEEGIGAKEMYVIKGDTWIVTIRYGSMNLSLRQETFETAKEIFEIRISRGWVPQHVSDAWSSLTGYIK